MNRWRWPWQSRRLAGGGWRSLGLLVLGALLVLALLGGIAVADGNAPPAPTEPVPTEPAQTEQTPGRADESSLPLLTPPPLKPGAQRPKLDGALAAVAEAAATAGDETALATAQANGLAVSGGMVRVLVETDNPDLAPATSAIVAAGGAVESEYADTIQALMPPSGLDTLAASPDVRYVRAPAGRTPGSVPGRAR